MFTIKIHIMKIDLYYKDLDKKLPKYYEIMLNDNCVVINSTEMLRTMLDKYKENYNREYIFRNFIVSNNCFYNKSDNHDKYTYDVLPRLSKKLCKTLPESLLRELSTYFAISGGAMLNVVTGLDEDIKDIDLFPICDSEIIDYNIVRDQYVNIIKNFCDLIVEHLHKIYDDVIIHWMVTNNAISLQIEVPALVAYDLQFIKRVFDSPLSVIKSFDLPPCMISFYQESLTFTSSSLYTLTNSAFVLQPERMSVPSRVKKYNNKGFSILIPKNEETCVMYDDIIFERAPNPLKIRDSFAKYPVFYVMYSLYNIYASKKDENENEIYCSGFEPNNKEQQMIVLKRTYKVCEINFLSKEERKLVLDNWKKINFCYDLNILTSENIYALYNCEELHNNWKIENPSEKMFNLQETCECLCEYPSG